VGALTQANCGFSLVGWISDDFCKNHQIDDFQEFGKESLEKQIYGFFIDKLRLMQVAPHLSIIPPQSIYT